MPDFKSHEEQEAFYMILSEGKGLDYLDWRLSVMSEGAQQRKLDELREFRTKTGRPNPE